MMERQIYSVSELNNNLKSYISRNPDFSEVAVLGEISNYKLYPSGHRYFSLKDAEGQLKCVMFKGSSSSLNFQPENGMQVIAFGSISVYERDGIYQLYCKSMMAAGQGNLQIAFEQLKAKLDAEGLFDPLHKKEIPDFPKKIAVITSPAGAAVRDVIRILGQRWPLSEVLVVPVRVQGIEAPGEIADAIEAVNVNKLADLIITGRGGGSMEDLWAFNEEIVARAIYASEIPVISAVGHEPDVTISDYVADRRASTPSNAAELSVPDREEIRALLRGFSLRLNPDTYINDRRQDFDRIRERMITALERILSDRKHAYISAASALDALSPLKVLTRGYSIAEKEGKTVKSAAELKQGDRLKLVFADGKKDAIIE